MFLYFMVSRLPAAAGYRKSIELRVLMILFLIFIFERNGGPIGRRRVFRALRLFLI